MKTYLDSDWLLLGSIVLRFVGVIEGMSSISGSDRGAATDTGAGADRTGAAGAFGGTTGGGAFDEDEETEGAGRGGTAAWRGRSWNMSSSSSGTKVCWGQGGGAIEVDEEDVEVVEVVEEGSDLSSVIVGPATVWVVSVSSSMGTGAKGSVSAWDMLEKAALPDE